MSPEQVIDMIEHLLGSLIGTGPGLHLSRVPGGLLVVSPDGHHVLIAVTRAEIVAS